MIRTTTVLGHIDGISRLYDTLLQTAEIWIGDELYPVYDCTAEELVKMWLLDVDRVTEPTYSDIDDPIRVTMEIFWRKASTEDLYHILTDPENQPIDIGFDDRDRYYITLIDRSEVDEPFIDRSEFRQSASF